MRHCNKREKDIRTNLFHMVNLIQQKLKGHLIREFFRENEGENMGRQEHVSDLCCVMDSFKSGVVVSLVNVISD